MRIAGMTGGDIAEHLDVSRATVTNWINGHASATSVLLLGHQREDGRIFVTVEDDGAGGADPGGTGMLGVIDRIETLGGRVRIISPVGGPTRITLEVPCAS